MSDKLEREAMMAADAAGDLQYPEQDGIAAQLRAEHSHGYYKGYIAAATAREKALIHLRDVAKREIESRDAEIDSLRAKLGVKP